MLPIDVDAGSSSIRFSIASRRAVLNTLVGPVTPAVVRERRKRICWGPSATALRAAEDLAIVLLSSVACAGLMSPIAAIGDLPTAFVSIVSVSSGSNVADAHTRRVLALNLP
jgi:hypothetical protein